LRRSIQKGGRSVLGGLVKAGKFVGRGVSRAAAAGYKYRKPIVQSIGIALPALAAGIGGFAAGGPAGAVIGAGSALASQKDEIKNVVEQFRGKESPGQVSKADLDKAIGGVGKVINAKRKRVPKVDKTRKKELVNRLREASNGLVS